MDWNTFKADIEAGWKKLVATVEADLPEVEAVTQEIMTALADLAETGIGGPTVAAVSKVAQAIYGVVTVTSTAVQQIAPDLSNGITATQLVAAATAVQQAVPNIETAIKAVATDVQAVGKTDGH
jgi:hypothetical protein